MIADVLSADGAKDYMDENCIRTIAAGVQRRIDNRSQLAISHTPIQEISTEDDVEENIAENYSPKMEL